MINHQLRAKCESQRAADKEIHPPGGRRVEDQAQVIIIKVAECSRGSRSLKPCRAAMPRSDIRKAWDPLKFSFSFVRSCFRHPSSESFTVVRWGGSFPLVSPCFLPRSRDADNKKGYKMYYRRDHECQMKL